MIASTQTNHPLHGRHVAAANPQSRLAAARKRLTDTGLRITQPRIAILKLLIASDLPVSIDQTYSSLNSKACDLVTVYRCLGAFEEIGLVRRSFMPNGVSLYQISDGNNAGYHVISKDTQAIRALDAGSSAELSAAIKRVEEQLKADGYENVSHVLGFFGNTPGGGTARNRAAKQVEIPADL